MLLHLIHKRFAWLEPYAIEDLQIHAPEVWQQILEVRRKTMTQTLIQLLEEGKHEGILKKELESELVVEIILASLEALTKPKLLTTQAKSASQMVSLVINTMIDSCRKD